MGNLSEATAPLNFEFDGLNTILWIVRQYIQILVYKLMHIFDI